ncbi:hypothetical protein GCM10027360_55800 [Amycolatopsis echigonensis]
MIDEAHRSAADTRLLKRRFYASFADRDATLLAMFDEFSMLLIDAFQSGAHGGHGHRAAHRRGPAAVEPSTGFGVRPRDGLE